jgi:hypothetical protein
MLRLRTAFKAFWITALLLFAILWSFALPRFFLEPEYGLDSRTIHTVSDVPRLIFEFSLMAGSIGLGAFIGASLIDVSERPKLALHIVAAMLSVVLAYVGTWILGMRLPSKWLIRVSDDAVLSEVSLAICVAFWAALATWICMRWISRRATACA